MRPNVQAAVAALLALAAVIAGFAAREAGIGEAPATAAPSEQSVAATQSDSIAAETESLTLSLSAPDMCETQPAHGTFGDVITEDDEGNAKHVRQDLGWVGVSEVPVEWKVTGGTAPYTLVIDGESRDAAGPYEGSSDTASVSCAQRSSGAFFEHLEEKHRRYRTEPEVDSGLKTIRATVTDGAGATADASVKVYVILELAGGGSILKRGKTYRVFGHLITAPTNYDVEVGNTIEPQCDSPPPGTRCEPAFRLWLVGTDAHIGLYASDGAEGERRYSWGPDRPAGASAGEERTTIDAAFDALVESVGKLPQR